MRDQSFRCLNLTVMTLGKSPISHKRLITKIGDTVGSHLDLQVLPHVLVLRHTGTSAGMIRNQLVAYLYSVACVCSNLARVVLRENGVPLG
jgi:hypothetical protein